MADLLGGQLFFSFSDFLFSFGYAKMSLGGERGQLETYGRRF
jgi:hypothetical protein